MTTLFRVGGKIIPYYALFKVIRVLRTTIPTILVVFMTTLFRVGGKIIPYYALFKVIRVLRTTIPTIVVVFMTTLFLEWVEEVIPYLRLVHTASP